MSRRLGELLAAEMARRGMTDDDAARELGVSQPTVTRWRLGRTVPTTGHYVRPLARFLRLTQADVRAAIEASPRVERAAPADGPETLAALLLALEDERGLTGASAYNEYGIDKSAYYRWRADLSVPPLRGLPDLAARLGVDEERLVMAIYRTELAR